MISTRASLALFVVLVGGSALRVVAEEGVLLAELDRTKLEVAQRNYTAALVSLEQSFRTVRQRRGMAAVEVLYVGAEYTPGKAEVAQPTGPCQFLTNVRRTYQGKTASVDLTLAIDAPEARVHWEKSLMEGVKEGGVEKITLQGRTVLYDKNLPAGTSAFVLLPKTPGCLVTVHGKGITSQELLSTFISSLRIEALEKQLQR